MPESADCSTAIGKRATVCWECYCRRREANRQHCIDCGVVLRHGRHGNLRCHSCYVIFSRTKPRRACSVPGCDKPHMALGYCRNHYQQLAKPRETIRDKTRHQLVMVASLPCQVCGYSRLRSHVHRHPLAGKDGGLYEWGNIVAICARCHEEIHRGLIPCPEPLLAP